MTMNGNNTAPAAAAAVGCALLTGFAGDALLRTDRPGINLWLTSLIFLLLLVLIHRRYQTSIPGASFGLLFLSGLFLFSFAWRDSPALNAMALLASGIAAILAAWRAQGGLLLRSALTDYARGLIRTGFGAAVGAFPLVLWDADWSHLRNAGGGSRVARLGKGLALALPPVVGFGALFAAADPIFGSFYHALFNFDLSTLVSHLAIIGCVAWLAAGLLRRLVVPDLPSGPPAPVLAGGRWGATEVMVILGSVTLVFLAFVAVQLRTLFGGDAFVLEQTGLTYAEYAREGFFHMTGAAALVLPLLLFLEWIGRLEGRREVRGFRALAIVLLVLLGLVLLSALHRMRIYQHSYGLTELRVYTVAFMAWLAAALGWFSLTVLGGKRERFVPGALSLGFLVVLGLHLINPDRMIAAANLNRLAQGAPFDARYAVSLSDDAVPVLVRALDRMPPSARCALLQRLDRKEDDWRSWNLSRARARALAQSMIPSTMPWRASCAHPGTS